MSTASNKQRFLSVYAEIRTVAGACERAGIHRSTVYRWKADLSFAAAMEKAWRAGYRLWLQEVYTPRAEARQRAHEQRNAELRPMRRQVAANARAAKLKN